MIRNTAREIAVHLAYELSFTDKTVKELLDERLDHLLSKETCQYRPELHGARSATYNSTKSRNKYWRTSWSDVWANAKAFAAMCKAQRAR